MEVARPGSVGEDAEDWRRRPRDIVGKHVFALIHLKAEEYFTSFEKSFLTVGSIGKFSAYKFLAFS